MSANTLTACTLLIAGLVSACGSGSDTTTPTNFPETIASDSPSSDDTANANVEETAAEADGESNPVESDDIETGDSAAQVANQNSTEGSTETNPAAPQNDGNQEQEPVNPEVENSNTALPIAEPIAINQRVSFSTAKLLVDLVPNGDSYPAKFHRLGDKLFFLTVDTDPRFANCSSHWGNLGEDDKRIAFNLVATHPETGEVAMNKEIMTLGDFTEDPNTACAGYNGTIMDVFEQNWVTPLSATGEQQFTLSFGDSSLGPDQVWMTDGSESNTSPFDTGSIAKQIIFEDEKVFFVNADGLSVSNTLAGDRRKLFEADPERYHGIRRVVKSPARQATFEIRVGHNRHQIWTYDLDTDEWDKKFSLKPDYNTYEHQKTLLVYGQTLLSQGYDSIKYESALGLSNNYGDVTSFEILTDSAPRISKTDKDDTNNQLLYSTTDYSVESNITTIWSYREGRIEKLFSISEPDLNDIRVIAGVDDRIYVAGSRELGQGSEFDVSLDLWSYNLQTEQLVKLSNNDWYAVIYNHPSPDEGYVFRYLNTPDGLVFVNLTENSGRELWFTDGTPQGTKQLSDINPGTGNSDPLNFYYSGDAVYFSANDGIHGREPWMIHISR